MTTAADRTQRATHRATRGETRPRAIPRGALEHSIRIVSALLVIVAALALIAAPGLPAGAGEDPRSLRIGGGIGLLVLLLALQLISPRKR